MKTQHAHRLIVLDTETTGLSTKDGNRIIEIGCVELLDRRLTGNNFHVYINPERDSEPGALQVHGLTREFLADKPTFKAVAQDFIKYIRDSELIIHNAPFDVGFLNYELTRRTMQTLWR
jgi:DNA polymerase-3 subunit epsilon